MKGPGEAVRVTFFTGDGWPVSALPPACPSHS